MGVSGFEHSKFQQLWGTLADHCANQNKVHKTKSRTIYNTKNHSVKAFDMIMLTKCYFDKGSASHKPKGCFDYAYRSI